MALTAQERERVRYHLGYLNVQLAASIQYGIPRPIQTMFLVETAMDNLIVEAEARLRITLDILDKIECQLFESSSHLFAARLGDLEIRDGAPDRLEREYKRWAGRLADMLGVPRYPYSERFTGGGGAGNVPVSG